MIHVHDDASLPDASSYDKNYLLLIYQRPSSNSGYLDLRPLISKSALFAYVPQNEYMG